MPLSMSQDSFHQFRNLPLRINSDKELKSIGGINYFQLFQLSRSWQAKNVAFLLLSSLSLTSIKVTSSPMALRGFLVLLNCCTSCYCAASRERGDTIRQFRRLDRRSRTTMAALRPTQVDFEILVTGLVNFVLVDWPPTWQISTIHTQIVTRPATSPFKFTSFNGGDSIQTPESVLQLRNGSVSTDC